MKKKTRYLWLIAGCVLLAFGLLLWFVVGPSGPIVVSKRTTYLTAPLRDDGLVDYEKAIVEMQAAQVSPQENAAVPFIQAMWPCQFDPQAQVDVCGAIGIPIPSQTGMTSFHDEAMQLETAAWLNQQQETKLGANQFQPIAPLETMDILCAAYDVVWTRDQLPPLAAWVDRQAPHFAKLREMNERPKFFLPSPALVNQQHDTLLASTLPSVQVRRDASRALTLRAFLHIGENQPVEAWKDIQTIFSLSRCHSQPGFLIELLVCNAIRGVAFEQLLKLIDSGQCDAQLLDEIERYLKRMKPFDEVASSINIMERLAGLDAAIGLSTHEINAAHLTMGPSGMLETCANAPYDRNAMLAKLNQWYDRITAVVEIDDLDDRRAARDQLEIDIHTELQNVTQPGAVAAAILNQSARGEMVAQMLAGLLIPAVSQASQAEERVNAQRQLLLVVVALEKYKIETGTYPDTLTPLVDRIDPRLLQDPFAQGLLRYERRPPGYLLYSVFHNRQDDGGDSQSGEIVDGDWTNGPPTNGYQNADQVIRLPLPARSLADMLPWNAQPVGGDSTDSLEEKPGTEASQVNSPQQDAAEE
ncbi:MAG: hypothetical protein ACIALR_17680 [Blastopirellula sp. JB062]